MADSGDSYADLAEVRAAIDDLDADLVELLVRRQRLVRAAGTFKRTDLEVQAPDRAAAVVATAAARAEEAGGSGELIGDIYRAMVDSFIAYERRNVSSAPPSTPPAPND
ncbi:chorismate mutase [Saccharopolyspora oryzae]|uniref:Chorismate mutase n=1 Tax=Saccharopolyspora oryzae TaxID=2997343 RepID=A0ABT4VAH2_9PSEU|nr:chorismate mutase [Saccharopolyspora oryzae]MDA3630414.1 chorismate mutase [Saccharopolyspora oryzae]